jgi:hypothetical protein
MRRAIPLAAIMISLLAFGCGTKAQKHEDDARALRAAIPSVAAYWADHDTYAGMTLAALRSYDPSIADLSIVRVGQKTYCVESGTGDPHVFFDTQTFELMLGSCGDPKNGKPYESPSNESRDRSSESSDPGGQLLAAVPVIEVYHEEHNGYVGMTLAKLREWDPAIADISIASADRSGYCIELVSGDSQQTTFLRGPAGEPMPGSCSDQSAGESGEAPGTDDYSSWLESADATDLLRSSVPAIEAYRSDRNAYSGMTLAILRKQYGAVLPDLEIVSATEKTYCIEISVDGESAFKQGPAGDIKNGTCPT